MRSSTIRPYCYLEAARGTTMYQISDEATRATASQSKRPLSVSQRRMLIVIAQRIHCADVLFIEEPRFRCSPLARLLITGCYVPSLFPVAYRAPFSGEKRTARANSVLLSVRLAFISPIAPCRHAEADDGEANQRFYVRPRRCRLGGHADRPQRQLGQVIWGQEFREGLQSVRQQEERDPQARAERHRKIDQIDHRGRRVWLGEVADRQPHRAERNRPGHQNAEELRRGRNRQTHAAEGEPHGEQQQNNYGAERYRR